MRGENNTMTHKTLRCLTVRLSAAVLALLMIVLLVPPVRQVFALVLPTVSATLSSKTDYTLTVSGLIYAGADTYTPTNNRGFNYRVKGTTGWHDISLTTTLNPFSTVLSNLKPDTTYEVRAWTDTSGTRAYSSIIEAKTDKIKSGPTLNTPTYHNLTATSATIQCRIVDDGNAPPIILRRIWVGTGAKQDGVDAIGLFSFTFTNLVPNTTYEAFAEVRNSFSTSISAKLTFTTANGYRINYVLNGGNLPPGFWDYYTQGVTFTLPIPLRAGYVFGGWYNNVNFFGSAITTIPATSTGDKTYYAKWIPQYSITYTLNGGTNPAGAPTTYRSDQITILPTPTRSGYTFGGWFDNAQLTGSSISSIGLGSSGDKAFWAKWSVPVTATPTTKPATPTVSPSASPSVSPSPSNKPAVTLTPGVSATVSPGPTTGVSPSVTAAATPSGAPTATPAATASPSVSPSAALTVTPAGTSVAGPSPEPTTVGTETGQVTLAPTQPGGEGPDGPGGSEQIGRLPLWLIILLAAIGVAGLATGLILALRVKRKK